MRQHPLIAPLTVAVALAAAVFSSTAVAAEAGSKKVLTPQQAHYRDCRIKAAGLPYDSRMAYMRECVSGQAPADEDVSGIAMTGPRAKACRIKAADRPRDDRLDFMKQCMAGGMAADDDVIDMSASPDKAKACHAKVGSIARDDRIAFMKKCLAE